MSRLAVGRFREFVVMVRDEVLATYAGLGMNLESVLEVEAPGEECTDDVGNVDLAVWEGPIIVAVVRLRAGNHPEVRRFNG